MDTAGVALDRACDHISDRPASGVADLRHLLPARLGPVWLAVDPHLLRGAQRRNLPAVRSGIAGRLVPAFVF